MSFYCTVCIVTRDIKLQLLKGTLCRNFSRLAVKLYFAFKRIALSSTSLFQMRVATTVAVMHEEAMTTCLPIYFFCRRVFLLLWLGISMILHYELKCNAGYQICRDSDKRLSLISFSISAGFSHVTLALNKNAL